MLHAALAIHPALGEGLRQFISRYSGLVKVVGSSVISLVALFIITALIVKAILAHRKNDMKAAIKPIIAAISVVIIAVVGVGGLIALVNSANLGDTGLQMNNQLSVGTSLMHVPTVL